MEPSEFVRPATTDDVSDLALLEQAARAALEGVERGGPAWLETHPRLAADGWFVRVADPGWVTFVGGLGQTALGFATMRLPVGRRRATAEVDCIFVDEGARELGLGAMLLDELITSAQSAGATEIDAQALPGDRETKNMFERAGLVARLIVVSRRLG